MNTDSINELSKTVLEHCAARDWDPDERALAISVAIEAGELLEHFQFDNYAIRSDFAEVSSEVADVFIYMLQLCAKQNINLGEAVVAKLEKSAKKYPVGLTHEEQYTAKLEHRKRNR